MYNVVFFPILMQRLVINPLDRVMTSSKAALRELMQTFGLSEEKLCVVYSGIDADFFMHREQIKREPNHLLFVGNAQDPRKGIRYLFEALRMINPAIRLTIVDQGIPIKTVAPQLASKIGVEKRITFTGRISPEQLRNLYQRSWALVMPSLYEGFGFPVLEAMACGCPVISSNRTSMPEIVNGAGILVDPENVATMTNKMFKVLTEEKLRGKLSKNGIKRSSQYNWNKKTEKIHKNKMKKYSKHYSKSVRTVLEELK